MSEQYLAYNDNGVKCLSCVREEQGENLPVFVMENKSEFYNENCVCVSCGNPIKNHKSENALDEFFVLSHL